MPRVARSAETRESAARRKPYVPPAKLAAPTPPPGYHTRWVRVKSGQADDPENVSRREYEGYRFVTAEEAARWEGTETWRGTQHASGPFQGFVGRKDLVLMVNDESNVESRQDYYQGLARRELDAIDANMFNAAKDHQQHIAFDRPKRKTRVATGPGSSKPQFADDHE